MKQSATYEQLLQTEQWKDRRKEILERDNHQCLCCGAKDNLQVHHRQYHRDAISGEKIAPWLYAGKYFITLCESCHQLGHKNFNIPLFTITLTKL